MGKFVIPVDVVTETAKVLKAVRKYLKTVTCNVGTVQHSRLLDNNNNKICVTIDNDGKLGSDLSSFLGKKKSVTIVDTVEFEGLYDWTSDTFFRPSSSILIYFSNK